MAQRKTNKVLSGSFFMNTHETTMNTMTQTGGTVSFAGRDQEVQMLLSP